MKRWKLAAVCAATSLLVACGGGGGGGVDNPVETRSIAVAGTAAKGRMANALVTVHAIRADGSVDDTALASTRTDSNGDYSLDFTGNPDQAHLVRVTAEAGTTHVDEVTGEAQALPAGFVMRSLLSAGLTDAARATVTPFSEMAIAAAEKLGGLTSENTDRAVSTMTQLLGFNPVQVAVKSTSDTGTTPDEQRLAVMLAAVSQLASTGALGCDSGSAGDKAECVVDVLAAASSATSYKLESGAVDVSASLTGAVQAVLDTPSLAGAVSPSLLTTTMANLQCSGTACLPQAPTADNRSVAGAIAAVKALFTELRSDFTALFGLDTATTGDVGAQLTQFGTAMSAVQLPVEMVGKDLAALTVGIEHYYDYKAGRTPQVATSRGVGQVTTSPGVSGSRAAISCVLYTDSTFGTFATTPANANAIFCGASYYVAAPSDTHYRHGFRIVPGDTEGTFLYSVRAESRPTNPPAPSTAMSSLVNGTVQASVDSQGRIRSFQVNGALPPAFEQDWTTVIPGRFEWTLSGTREIDASDAKTSRTQVSGTVTGFDASNAVRSSLQIHSGTFSEEAGMLGPLGLDLTWAANGSSFRGGFATGATVADKSGTSMVPSKVVLEGKLGNDVNGTATQFLSGKFTASVTGYGDYDSTQAASATNAYGIALGIQGSATAPGRPLLQFSGGASLRSDDDRPLQATMQYRSFANGEARMTVNAAHYRSPTGAWISEINEVGSGVSITMSSDAEVASVRSAPGDKIGELDLSSGILTFVDGSFISAELGQ